MADIPEEMLTKGRPPDPDFHPDECLYRRVRPEDWAADEVELDAIELPDMSVNREKYGPPEWVRISPDEGQDFSGWGVIGFRVGDIPPQIQDRGVFVFRFRAVHVPLKRNYPHSEVRAFEETPGGEVHIGKALIQRIEPDVHMRWREQLRRKCRIVLKQA